MEAVLRSKDHHKEGSVREQCIHEAYNIVLPWNSKNFEQRSNTIVVVSFPLRLTEHTSDSEAIEIH